MSPHTSHRRRGLPSFRMRVLVTGATGFLGKRLVTRLRERGDDVVATSRDADRARRALGDDVATFSWDYRSEPFPAAALEGVDAVFHLMGENIAAGRWTARKKEALRGSRIESSEKLIAALDAAGEVTDFLCASAIGIYPGDTHDAFDEDSALPPPATFMTRLCADWEAAAARAATPARRSASLRIGLVLGETGMLAPLVPLSKLGLGGPLGDGRQHVPWVHADDLVDMLLFVLAHRELDGPVNLVGPESVPLDTFGRTLASLLRRPYLFRAPAFAIRAALGEASALLLSSYHVVPTRLEKAGFPFRFRDHRSALEDVLASFY